jgi:hypothetical protein
MIWGDLAAPYALNASSYRMGGHSGHMSEYNQGAGAWYPGATGVCNTGNMTDYANWNDRVRSRYRN